MKIRLLFIFGFSVIIAGAINGQSVSLDSVKQERLFSYFFTVQTGALVGCNECKVGKEVTFSSSTIHGIKVGKKLRVGAGLGFDSYAQWQAIPLFGSVSWDLLGKRNKLFTQINYGYARAWKPFKEQEFGLKDMRGGTAFSAMLGYRINYGDIHMALLAGYKFQSATANYEYGYYSWLSSFRNYETSTQQTVKENMNRFAISLAVGWR